MAEVHISDPSDITLLTIQAVRFWEKPSVIRKKHITVHYRLHTSKHMIQKSVIKEGGVEAGYFRQAFWSVPMSQGHMDT